MDGTTRGDISGDEDQTATFCVKSSDGVPQIIHVVVDIGHDSNLHCVS
jgi:hypothetical protein